MTRLEPGTTAPAFTLTDAAGTKHKLTDFAGGKVILYYYPAAMTPGCTKQACDFRDNMSVFTKHGYTVIGVSPDVPAKLEKFVSAEKLPFLLLSNPDHSIIKK